MEPIAHEYKLIEAFRNGDDFAFVSLYNRYKGPIYTYCVRMLLDREAAQDAMQETFLRIYENRKRLLNTASFRAWLFTVARNQCLNHLRTAKRRVRLDERMAARLEAPGSGPLEKWEQIALVTHFLGLLKPEYREVIVLREFQNMSYAEIAAVTRSTMSAVKSRLFKARRKLAQSMEPLIQHESERLAAVQS